MIHAKLNAATGRLSDISRRGFTYPEDVQLVTMPSGSGPWTYDSANKLAVSVSQTEIERLDQLDMPPRVRAALVLRASSRWTMLATLRKQRIMDIIDSYADLVTNALSQ